MSEYATDPNRIELLERFVSGAQQAVDQTQERVDYWASTNSAHEYTRIFLDAPDFTGAKFVKVPGLWTRNALADGLAADERAADFAMFHYQITGNDLHHLARAELEQSGRAEPNEAISYTQLTDGLSLLAKQGWSKLVRRARSLPPRENALGQPAWFVNEEVVMRLPASLLMHAAVEASEHVIKEYKDETSGDIMAALDQMLIDACQAIREGRRVNPQTKSPPEKSFAITMNALRTPYGEAPQVIEQTAGLYFLQHYMRLENRFIPGMTDRQAIKEAYQALRRDLARFTGAGSFTADEDKAIARIWPAAIDDVSAEALTLNTNRAYAEITAYRNIRLLVDAVAAGRVLYSEILSLAQNQIQPLSLRGNRRVDGREAGEESETIIIDSVVDYEILAPGEGLPRDSFERQPNRVRLKNVPKDIDPERVMNLIERVGLVWDKGRVEIIARSLESKKPKKRSALEDEAKPIEPGKLEKQPIQYVYYIALLYEALPDGTEIIHAVAEHPQKKEQRHKKNAMVVWDGRRGLPTGKTWDDAFRNKGIAYQLGAERLLHIGDIYGRALEKIDTRFPLKPLRRRERMLGGLATEHMLAQEAPNTV